MKVLLTLALLITSSSFAMSEKQSDEPKDKSVCMHKAFFADKAKIDKMLAEHPKTVEKKPSASVSR